MWAAISTMVLAPPVNWLLVFKLDFGLDGAAFSMVIIWATQSALLLVLVILRDRRLKGTPTQTWHGW